MVGATRRQFLGDLGRGALTLGVGISVADRLGLALALEGEDERLDFGELEGLVALMQETSAGRLQEILVEKLKQGLELRTLIGAAALANARTFGGHDYVGYHAAMALAPAYRLARCLEGPARALPVLKVIYRNTARIQAVGGRDDEALHAIEPAATGDPEAMRAAMLRGDISSAERTLVKASDHGLKHAYEALQPMLQQDIEVHRIVLAWRAFDTLRFTGEEHAATMLRQVVRYCADQEEGRKGRGRPVPSLRKILPGLVELHGLTGKKPLGTRTASDPDLESWSRVFFAGTREDAAEQAAEVLGEGYAPGDVGEALSLAANALLLHDPGRAKAASLGRYKGSVHGASVGVHASDSARAYRNIVRVVDGESAAANLIVGAYHTAGQTRYVRQDRFPYAERKAEYAGKSAADLLGEVLPAIEARDQARACAIVESYGEQGGAPEAVFEKLVGVAVESDGALHAEKYFATVAEDFNAGRPAFRWRHLLALTRVSASEAGASAPGLDAARELLGV